MECCRLMELAKHSTVLEMAMSGISHSNKMFETFVDFRLFFVYFRAEVVSTIFLQKARHARRVYATVINIRTNVDGYKAEGITFPNGKMQNQLMQELYKQSGVHPNEVSYFEAHGTGTPSGDPQELNSITEMFCKGRTEPLLIGSVKSNMGHSEPASGMCSIAKVLIAMETGTIPANLHFKNPNPAIPALLDGRLKVTRKTHIRFQF